MRRFRLSLATLMGLVVVIALGVVGLREGTPLWGALSFWGVAIAVLGCVIHGAVATGRRRAGLFGFALFAGTFMAVSVVSEQDDVPVALYPVRKGLDALHPLIHPETPQPVWITSGTWAAAGTPQPAQVFVDVTGTGSGTMFVSGATVSTGWPGNLQCYYQVGHSLVALLFGLAGGLWAAWIGSVRRSEPAPSQATAAGDPDAKPDTTSA